MGETEILGYIVTSVITLGAFIAVIQRFTQPINDLRIVIQKLNDRLDSQAEKNAEHTKRIDEHGKEIDGLKGRMDVIETRVDMYHSQRGE